MKREQGGAAGASDASRFPLPAFLELPASAQLPASRFLRVLYNIRVAGFAAAVRSRSHDFHAKVAELVDALDLGSSGVTRESSSLSFRTRKFEKTSLDNWETGGR